MGIKNWKQFNEALYSDLKKVEYIVEKWWERGHNDEFGDDSGAMAWLGDIELIENGFFYPADLRGEDIRDALQYLNDDLDQLGYEASVDLDGIRIMLK